MVRVIKDNSNKKCICSHCKSILEYSIKDTFSTTYFGDVCSYINCPMCGKPTLVNVKFNN